MAFSDLVTATYDRMGVSTTDAMLTNAAVKRLVNTANQYVATVHDWPWQQVESASFPTVAGQQDYTPAADFLRAADVRVTGPVAGADGMTLYSPGELDDRWPATIQGQPREYATWAGVLRLAPTPDSVYTIGLRYIKLEADLVNDGDVPLIPAQFAQILVEYAAFLGLRMISEESRAQVARSEFDRWLQIVMQDRKRSTQPVRVRVRPGSLI